MSQLSLNPEFENPVKATLTEEHQLINNKNTNNNSNNKLTDEDESAKSPNFFQDYNAIKINWPMHTHPQNKVEKSFMKNFICWN